MKSKLQNKKQYLTVDYFVSILAFIGCWLPAYLSAQPYSVEEQGSSPKQELKILPEIPYVIKDRGEDAYYIDKSRDIEEFEAVRNQNGIRISLDGYYLLKVDKDRLLAKDKDEILLILRHLSDLIGEIPKFDFEYQSVSKIPGNGLTVHLTQTINNISAGTLMLNVDGESYLSSLRVVLISENQANIIEPRQLSKDEAIEIALTHLQAKLGRPVERRAKWDDVSKSYNIIDDDLTVEVIYIFEDSPYNIVVNALTGEVRFSSSFFD